VKAKEMIMVMDGGSGQLQMREGDDFVCPNCGCEIRLRHHGDESRMPQMQPFICCCGTTMRKEAGGGTAE